MCMTDFIYLIGRLCSDPAFFCRRGFCFRSMVFVFVSRFLFSFHGFCFHFSVFVSRFLFSFHGYCFRFSSLLRCASLRVCSRIVFNLVYLVPYSWSHCTFSGFMVIAAPYQLLQIAWMFLIIRKATSALSRGKKPKLAVPVAAGGVKVD